MRTTVTLDPDVERLLMEEIHRTRQSFKAVLNQAIRKSFKLGNSQKKKPFVVEARPLGLKPAYQGMNLTHLAAQLEDEEILARMAHKKP